MKVAHQEYLAEFVETFNYRREWAIDYLKEKKRDLKDAERRNLKVAKENKRWAIQVPHARALFKHQGRPVMLLVRKLQKQISWQVLNNTSHRLNKDTSVLYHMWLPDEICTRHHACMRNRDCGDRQWRCQFLIPCAHILSVQEFKMWIQPHLILPPNTTIKHPDDTNQRLQGFTMETVFPAFIAVLTHLHDVEARIGVEKKFYEDLLSSLYSVKEDNIPAPLALLPPIPSAAASSNPS